VSDAPWTEGETAALKRAGTPTLLVTLARGPQRIGNDAVLDLTSQIGEAPGASVTWLGAEYRLLRPSLADRLGAVRRGAQIVTAKDAAALLFMAGVGPGDHVAEAGAGSGALTVAIAHAVGPLGSVTTFDRRVEFLDAARSNLKRAGLADRVRFVERDVVADGLTGEDFASVLLDLPDPWAVLRSARSVLRLGGYVATYTPTYNQLEQTVRALRAERFDEVRALELLERGLHVAETGTRPSFEMLGHTGFLAVGRKVD
jgi:tRNA (adenine57-N1/adenine58-N1)-methyltransferase